MGGLRRHQFRIRKHYGASRNYIGSTVWAYFLKICISKELRIQGTKAGDTADMKKSETAPFLSQSPPPPPEVQSPPGAPPFPQKSLSPLIPNKSRPSPEKPGKFHMGRPRPLPFSTDCIPGMGKEKARYGKKRRPFQKRAPLIAGS